MISLYPRLAAGGIIKNRRTYFPYILTCVGMIMINYIISFLSLNSFVEKMTGGESIQLILRLGSIVMIVFSVIFLLYTNSFLIRRRKTEFGLYNILGMGKRNIARILLWETLIIYAASELLGLSCGILFSKLAELLLTKMLSGEASYEFTVNLKSIWNSIVSFGIIFLFISANNLRQIHLTDPIELMHSKNTGEKPPKANWLFAAAGAVILSAAYYMAVTIEEPVEAIFIFFIAVIMVIIATYLLFMAGSVAICKALQKNKSYYYKTNHFISVSQMIYRMKRNGAGLASICILSTMTLVTLSSTICLYAGEEKLLRMLYPRNIAVDIRTTDEEFTSSVYAAIDETLGKYGAAPENILHYSFLDIGCGFSDDTAYTDVEEYGYSVSEGSSDVRQLYIITVDDYNRLMGKNETLEADEIILYSTKNDYKNDHININGFGSFRIKSIADEAIPFSTNITQIIPSMFLFVKDEAVVDALYNYQLEVYGEYHSYKHDYYGFDLSCSDEIQKEINTDIVNGINEIKEENPKYSYGFYVSCAANDRADFYAIYGGLFFLGVLFGGIFICAAVLIMYYKQISEGFEDKGKFDILQKVGMTKKEIRQSINSQVLTVFFLPLLAAGIHTAFAFPLISKVLVLFGMNDIPFFAAVSLCCFGAFAVIYTAAYILTSKSYCRIIT